MTHRKPKLVPILALCAISMHDAAGQLLNGQFVNAKLKNNQRRIYTVLVLPAQFNVPKFGAAGSEGRWREADLLRISSGYYFAKNWQPMVHVSSPMPRRRIRATKPATPWRTYNENTTWWKP